MKHLQLQLKMDTFSVFKVNCSTESKYLDSANTIKLLPVLVSVMLSVVLYVLQCNKSDFSVCT